MYTVLEIANVINGQIEGNPDLEIKGICDLIESKNDYLTYINSKKYNNYQNETNASVLIINNNFKIQNKQKTYIRVPNPAKSFIKVIYKFYPKNKPSERIHSTAILGKNITLGNNVQIGPYSIINNDVVIGDNVEIGSNTCIDNNSIIGCNTKIYSNVTIYKGIIIGKNCIIDAGTVIGADGFGLVTDKGIHHKMPHIGSVIINDFVWIGANCCIDRGTLNNTIIDEGTKLDNLIQIAHNVKIGKHCRISGQTAIAGSTILEDNVTLAGQVGIIDHLTIGKNSIVASKSAVYESIKPNSFVSGIPAKPHKNRLRQEVIINQLPNLLNRIRKLEKQTNS